LQQIGILIGLVQGAIRRVETKAPKRYVRLSWDMSRRRRGKAKTAAVNRPLSRLIFSGGNAATRATGAETGLSGADN
jgi:hypothetical protein